MTTPTPDEAAASLQAVLDLLDQGGRYCQCDPDNYEDRSGFIGSVSDARGHAHHEVHGTAIRALLAERKQLQQRLLNPCGGEDCETGGAAHCHRCPEAEADKLLRERDQLRATIDRVRTIHHRAECSNVRCKLGGWCIGCAPEGGSGCDENPWPCPTVLALDPDAKLPDLYAAWVLRRDHDAVAAQRDLLRAHVDVLVGHLTGCAKQTGSAFWQDLARDLADPEFRAEYFSRAAQVRALSNEAERL